MGHKLQSVINVMWKGKVHVIDVSVSRGVKNGRPEVLEIIHNVHDVDDTMLILNMDGDRTPAIDRHIIDVDSKIYFFCFTLLLLLLSITLYTVILCSVCRSCASLACCASMKKPRISLHRLTTEVSKINGTA